MLPQRLIQPEANVLCLSPEHDPKSTGSSPTLSLFHKRILCTQTTRSLLCNKLLGTKPIVIVIMINPKLGENEKLQIILYL